MFIADTHSDTLYRLGVDHLPPEKLTITPERLDAGGVSLQVFALWTGPDGGAGDVAGILEAAAAQASFFDRAGRRLVFSPSEAGEDDRCYMLSIEGGEAFDPGIGEIRRWYDRGVRMAAITWNHPNRLAFPAKGGSREGLTAYGLEAVREMQRIGMAVDTSHLNEAGFYDIFLKTDLPPMASHSCCRALCGHARNLTDDQLRLLIREGGYVGINFYPFFLREDGRAALADVVSHIDHVCQLGGSGIVGFGSDFDGIECAPEGLEQPEKVPALLDALRDRGYDEETVRGIAGENLRRYYRRIGA